MATTPHTRLGRIILLAAAALGACTDAPTAASIAPMASAVVTRSSSFTPIDIVLDGCTEPLHLTGTLHAFSHATIASSGNVHLRAHYQQQGVQGVGLLTGAKYHETGVSQFEVNINGPLPYTEIYILNFRLIGQGPDNNRLVHENFHMTINSNGEITADHVNLTVECR